MMSRAILYGSAVFLLLGVGFAAVNKSPPAAASSPKKTTRACEPPVGTDPFEDITPTWRLSDEVGQSTAPKDIKVDVRRLCSEDGQYLTKVTVEAPKFVPTLNVVPEESWDTEDYEHVRVYFANQHKRILEIRFNRFMTAGQKTLLLKKPHNVFRDTDLPEFETYKVTDLGNNEYRIEVEFLSELLPADLTTTSVVVVDPTQREPSQRYITDYRIYNHPISLIDLYVVSSYKTVTNADDNIFPAVQNHIYYSYWDGLCPTNLECEE